MQQHAAIMKSVIKQKTFKKLVHKDAPYDSQPNTENCGQPPTNITKRDT